MMTLENEVLVKYLLEHPEFFEQNPSVLEDVFVKYPQSLTKMRLRDPYNGRAQSLHQYQINLLRRQYEWLKRQQNSLLENGEQNSGLFLRLNHLAQCLLEVRLASQLPDMVVSGLKLIFDLPSVQLYFWGGKRHRRLPSIKAKQRNELQIFASHLKTPYCGPFSGLPLTELPVASILDELAGQLHPTEVDPQSISTAVLPLYVGEDSAETHTVGVLFCLSDDPARFAPELETDILIHLGRLLSAAMSRCMPVRSMP